MKINNMGKERSYRGNYRRGNAIVMRAGRCSGQCGRCGLLCLPSAKCRHTPSSSPQPIRARTLAITSSHIGMPRTPMIMAAHIQAHGGQVVKVGDAYYWYGEDRSNGYDNSPGVHAYMSTDLYNWTDLGVALRAVTSKSQLTDKSNADYAYFDKAYNLTKSDGSAWTLPRPTQSSRTSTPTPIRMVMARLIPYRAFSSVRRSSTTRRTSNTCCGGIRWKHHAGRFQLCTCTCGRGCFRQSGGPVHYGGCLSFA